VVVRSWTPALVYPEARRRDIFQHSHADSSTTRKRGVTRMGLGISGRLALLTGDGIEAARLRSATDRAAPVLLQKL